nr:helix-turn-helix domain-containing protein [Pseudomonas sp.]
MSTNPPFLPSPADKDSQFATTLSHGIDILASFRADSPTLANKDFVQRTGLSKSAVARLTHTLVQLGYLRRDGASGKYRL